MAEANHAEMMGIIGDGEPCGEQNKSCSWDVKLMSEPLIIEVQQRPFLWDFTRSDNKDVTKRMNGWKSVAVSMGLSDSGMLSCFCCCCIIKSIIILPPPGGWGGKTQKVFRFSLGTIWVEGDYP